jgi:catechol 2,3-dioxygenase-like lactoylglutathione lyase family enzyme
VITGTDFLIIGSTDIDRSVEFYGEVLGLERGKPWGKMPAREFETGNLTIAVMQSDAFGLEFKPNTHPLEFRVDDFDSAKAELEGKGVQFRGETIDSGFCKQGFFTDPDGNALGIHHRYAEGAPPR